MLVESAIKDPADDAWMMHDAWGTGMSAFMWLLVLLPMAALVVAVYALVRERQGAAPPSAPSTPPSPSAPEVAPQLDASHRRLLDEDEQRLYDLVISRNGDVPQGDLVPLSGFSKAKVSRVIDRLEQKGLVLRVRRGMGNRIVVPPAKLP